MTTSKNEGIIHLSGELIKKGVHTTTIDDKDVIATMKEIATNAVCIGLYNFSRFAISNISNCEFKVDKSEWTKAKNNLYRYLTIIDNEGEYLKDTLTTEEIDEAIEYTIFEKTSMEISGITSPSAEIFRTMVDALAR